MWIANKTYNEEKEPMGMPLRDYLDLVILCVCVCQNILTGSPELGRLTLNVVGTISWPEVLDWIKNEDTWITTFISLCFLIVHAQLQTAWSPCGHNFLAVLDCTLGIVSKYKLFIPYVAFLRVLHDRNQTSNHYR